MATKHTKGELELVLGRVCPEAPVFGFGITVAGKIPYLASAGLAPKDHALIVGEIYRKHVTTGFTEEEVEANGRRLVACWNACEPFSDPSAVGELVEAAEAFAVGLAVEHITETYAVIQIPHRDLANLRTALSRLKVGE